MATEIVDLSPEHLDAVAHFSASAWRRPRSAAYLRWRYLEAGFQRGLLAVRDGRCLAMMTAFGRPYLVDGERIRIWDAFDWYTLPELRNSGLGVRLLQHLMRGGEPVIVTGGSPDTRQLLPRMGFQTLDEVRHFSLPLTAERAAEALARRGVAEGLGRAAFTFARPLLRPRRRSVPPRGRVIAASTLGEEALTLDPRPGGRGCAPEWTAELVRWLIGSFPGMGHYLPLYFAVGSELAGWALLRVFARESGCDALLLDARAREPESALYTWMVSEVALCAAGLGAGLLAAATTCPALEEAFLRNRLRPVGRSPIHFYSATRKDLGAPVVFGAHWGDNPLVPYPTSWFDDPPGQITYS